MTVWKLHIAATLLMTGIIWMVQMVHYPLMSAVGRDAFAGYHARHTARITLLVLPLMVLEFATGLWLALVPGGPLPLAVAWIGLGLCGLTLVSTVTIQRPQHGRLSLHGSGAEIQALVGGNWLRTAAWSVRAGLLLWFWPTVVL